MAHAKRRDWRMIRAVFFDLDGTLYDRDAAIVRMAEVQFATFQHHFAHVKQSVFIERLVKLDGHGHTRTPMLHHRLAEQFQFPESVAEELEACFRSNYPQHCHITEDTISTLRFLRDRGVKLGIVTNGPTVWQSRKINALGVAPLFDTIVISGNEGFEKPDARIFALAMERCGVVAAESMFVGDHPVADIRGAQAAGMVPVWKKMTYWEVPEEVARIEKISEVVDLMEKF